MKRKTRPLKTGMGDLIRIIDIKIKEQKLIKEEISKEIQRYLNACQQNNGVISGVDYSLEKVRDGGLRMSFQDSVRKIDGLQSNLNSVIDKISDLEEKRKMILEIYKHDTDVETKVFYYREVMGYTQAMTALEVGYSIRQVQRIEKKLREKFGVRI